MPTCFEEAADLISFASPLHLAGACDLRAINVPICVQLLINTRNHTYLVEKWERGKKKEGRLSVEESKQRSLISQHIVNYLCCYLLEVQPLPG